MHVLDLNHDVLLSIISSMDRSSLKTFSMTCRHARDEAISLLFSSIRAEGDAQIMAFCEHFLRHPTLIPIVRRLEIHRLFRIGVSSDVPHPLIEILKRAHNLEHLCIDTDIDTPIDDLGSRPDLVAAITKSPRLTILGLNGNRSLANQVLHEIERIRVLCIFIGRDSTLTPLIQSSKSTLEALYVMPYKMVGGDHDRTTLRLDRTDCWPHLHFLDMRDHHGISTRTLTSAFPNLRILRLSVFYGERCPDMRDLNERGGPSWRTLDYVRGTVPEVYNLALSGHVRELELSFVGDMSLAAQEEVLDIVQHTQPLALTLRVPFSEKPSRLSNFFCRLLADCAHSLQYFESSGFIFDELVCFFTTVVLIVQLTLSFHT
jgi:hypothetical protein